MTSSQVSVPAFSPKLVAVNFERSAGHTQSICCFERTRRFSRFSWCITHVVLDKCAALLQCSNFGDSEDCGQLTPNHAQFQASARSGRRLPKPHWSRMQCTPTGKRRNRETQKRQVKAFKHADREAKRKLMAQPEISYVIGEQLMRDREDRTDENFAGAIHASHQLGLLQDRSNMFFCSQCGAVDAAGAVEVSVRWIWRVSAQSETQARKGSDAARPSPSCAMFGVSSRPFLPETALNVFDLPCVINLPSHEREGYRLALLDSTFHIWELGLLSEARHQMLHTLSSQYVFFALSSSPAVFFAHGNENDDDFRGFATVQSGISAVSDTFTTAWRTDSTRADATVARVLRE